MKIADRRSVATADPNAFIIGASGGNGMAGAQHFHNSGYRLCGRDEAILGELADRYSGDTRPP